MDTPTSDATNVISFVVRFVYDQPQAWHGIIRHVQSDAEMHFTHWAEMQKFVEQYVEIGTTPIQEDK